MLLNAAKCQGYSFYCFWVNKLGLTNVNKLNGLSTIHKNQRLTFINKWGIFSYLVTVIYWLSTLVKQYAAMARCLKSPIYIH